jgi:hypothetical protein
LNAATEAAAIADDFKKLRRVLDRMEFLLDSAFQSNHQKNDILPQEANP